MSWVTLGPTYTMAALGRLMRPTNLVSSRRLYSVFSSKPGGGRYFNSAKPHKVVATNHSTKRNIDEQSSSSSSSSSSPVTTTKNSSAEIEDGKVLTSQTAEDIQSSSGKAPTTLSSNVNTQTQTQTPPPAEPSTPRVPFHSSFTAQTYPLHQFFSVHRPLLNLSLPTSALFEPSKVSSDESAIFTTGSDSALGIEQQQFQQQLDEYNTDADADTARQLARALAINRLGGAVNWDEALARLGDIESIIAQERLGERVNMTPLTEWTEEEMSLDSTKRKRRKKMTKHKFKKRRRLQRAERRKMGK
ncbi:hypothetical protein Clacol_006861 [Clathrus columnatus]|uniref:Small ribosomal subunit protein mS38 n=1 Tax=Clathrus columnatus TaxID=1419009 RepID=A0AAV5AGI2_9AGAM|nr:hypothetical protein Clacol_006861 [Clathrus columnatus]